MEILRKFFDGGVPLLYGIGGLCTTLSVAGLLINYISEISNGTRNFSFTGLVFLLVIIAIPAFISWLLLTIGINEIKKSVKK
jgi:hypothetical protein